MILSFATCCNNAYLIQKAAKCLAAFKTWACVAWWVVSDAPDGSDGGCDCGNVRSGNAGVRGIMVELWWHDGEWWWQ